jgi:hypothetical protein
MNDGAQPRSRVGRAGVVDGFPDVCVPLLLRNVSKGLGPLASLITRGPTVCRVAFQDCSPEHQNPDGCYGQPVQWQSQKVSTECHLRGVKQRCSLSGFDYVIESVTLA